MVDWGYPQIPNVLPSRGALARALRLTVFALGAPGHAMFVPGGASSTWEADGSGGIICIYDNNNGKSQFLMGTSPFLMGQSPVLMGKLTISMAI